MGTIEGAQKQQLPILGLRHWENPVRRLKKGYGLEESKPEAVAEYNYLAEYNQLCRIKEVVEVATSTNENGIHVQSRGGRVAVPRMENRAEESESRGRRGQREKINGFYKSSIPQTGVFLLGNRSVIIALH